MAKYLRSRNGKTQQKRRKAFLLRLYGGVFLLCALIILFVWMLHRPFFRISDIALRGFDTLDTQEVTYMSQEILKGKYLFAIPKDSSIFYPKDRLIENLYLYDARIREADVDVEKDGVLVISIQEHEPVYVYCKDVCFYMNAAGYVFRDSLENADSLYLSFTDELGDYGLRESYVTEFWEEIVTLISFFEENDMHIKSVARVGEVDFSFITKKGIEIKIDFDESFENLERYLSIFIDSNSEMLGGDTVEYIDARFGKKIFYKLKEGNEEVLESEGE